MMVNERGAGEPAPAVLLALKGEGVRPVGAIASVLDLLHLDESEPGHAEEEQGSEAPKVDLLHFFIISCRRRRLDTGRMVLPVHSSRTVSASGSYLMRGPERETTRIKRAARRSASLITPTSVGSAGRTHTGPSRAGRRPGRAWAWAAGAPRRTRGSPWARR